MIAFFLQNQIVLVLLKHLICIAQYLLERKMQMLLLSMDLINFSLVHLMPLKLTVIFMMEMQ